VKDRVPSKENSIFHLTSHIHLTIHWSLKCQFNSILACITCTHNQSQWLNLWQLTTKFC